MNSKEGIPCYLIGALIILVVLVAVLASLVFGSIAGLFVIVASIILAWPAKPKDEITREPNAFMTGTD